MGSIAGEDVYCTLLTNDAYLPGVLTVAKALRDGGAQKKLAIVVIEEEVSTNTIREIDQAFDYVIDVKRITNDDLSQLRIMGREDLASTFTKFSLWQQTQFRKIVYLDADTLPLRAPDELFDIQAPFAAAPELGFPDCFNSGVMVLEPSLETFEALKSAAIEYGSFDGGDQGLLNSYFPDFHRLSFMYNMEMYPNYRLYMPAIFKHRSKMTIVHFIGKNKPWNLNKDAPPVDETAYSKLYKELLGKWWSVYQKVGKQSSR